MKIKNNQIVEYFTGSWSEIKKVNWPSREVVIKHTLLVLTASIVAILLTGLLDYGLTTLIQLVVENKKV